MNRDPGDTRSASKARSGGDHRVGIAREDLVLVPGQQFAQLHRDPLGGADSPGCAVADWGDGTSNGRGSGAGGVRGGEARAAEAGPSPVERGARGQAPVPRPTGVVPQAGAGARTKPGQDMASRGRAARGNGSAARRGASRTGPFAGTPSSRLCNPWGECTWHRAHRNPLGVVLAADRGSHTSVVTRGWSHAGSHTSAVTRGQSHLGGRTRAVTPRWSHAGSHTSVVARGRSHAGGLIPGAVPRRMHREQSPMPPAGPALTLMSPSYREDTPSAIASSSWSRKPRAAFKG